MLCSAQALLSRRTPVPPDGADATVFFKLSKNPSLSKHAPWFACRLRLTRCLALFACVVALRRCLASLPCVVALRRCLASLPCVFSFVTTFSDGRKGRFSRLKSDFANKPFRTQIKTRSPF